MGFNRLKFGALSFVLGISALFVLAPQMATAAVLTWDGEGADNNFSTAANWSGDVVPGDGDSVTIPYEVAMPTCGAVSLLNDLDPNTITLSGVSFTGSRPIDCYSTVSVTGNELMLSGNISANDTDSSQPYLNFEVAITAVAPLTIQSIWSTSSLSIGANDVTILGSSFAGGVSGSGDLTIDGYPSGSGGGSCSATNSAPDSSSFYGAVKTISEGSLSIISQPTALANNASSITKESDGYLSFRLNNGQNFTFTKPITLKGGTVGAYQNSDDDCNGPVAAQTLTLSGDITFTAETTFYLNKVNIIFTGALSGEEFVKIAEGQTGTISFVGGDEIVSQEKVITVDDTSTCYTVPFRIAANTKLVANADCGSLNYTEETPLEVLGTVSGTGKLPAIKIFDGGRIAPGNSPGCLATNGLVLEQGSTYDFELGGTTACSEHDQIVVTGSVNLGDGTLSTSLYNDYVPAIGQTYTIIQNDGTDAVLGAFSGLAEGAVFEQNGVTFSISYVGGDGNDIVLTVTAIGSSVAAPDTGLELISSNPMTALIGTVLVGAGIVLARRSLARR